MNKFLVITLIILGLLIIGLITYKTIEKFDLPVHKFTSANNGEIDLMYKKDSIYAWGFSHNPSVESSIDGHFDLNTNLGDNVYVSRELPTEYFFNLDVYIYRNILNLNKSVRDSHGNIIGHENIGTYKNNDDLENNN